MRKIIVAVTFRPFSDDYNSSVQELFLKSIASQSYENYEIIVTTFGESDPSEIIRKHTSKFCVYDSKTSSFFFKTICNGLKHAKVGESILLWTNADNVFDSNFFDEIVNHFVPGQAGTSYPNYQYYNLDDYYAGAFNNNYDFKNGMGRPSLKNRKYLRSFFGYDPNVYISESMFIDADLLLKDGMCWFVDLFHHKFVPGIVIFLALASHARSHVNLIFKAKLHVIENSRIPGSRSKDKCDDDLEVSASMVEIGTDRFRTQESSLASILDWFRAKGIADKYLVGGLVSSRKYIAHSSFSPVGSFSQKAFYRFYLIFWWFFPKKKFKLLRPVTKLKNYIFRSMNSQNFG